MKDSLGNRIKHNYEEAYKFRLPARMPIVIRLDGKCFHSFTRHMDKPFDQKLIKRMSYIAKILCKKIEGVELAYIQSDEISLLLHNYKKLESQGWFDNEIQKIVSVSAAIASSTMSRLYRKEVLFDSRVFVLPEAEVCNYFIWRQQDATKNSISMVAQSMFSHKQLHKKNGKQKMEMMFQKGVNWDSLPTHQKRGECVIYKDNEWIVDWDIPIFTQNRDFVEKLLQTYE